MWVVGRGELRGGVLRKKMKVVAVKVPQFPGLASLLKPFFEWLGLTSSAFMNWMDFPSLE